MTKNFLYYGDNLQILRDYIKDETIDLIYLDPPFKSNRDYNVLFAEQNGNKGMHKKLKEQGLFPDKIFSARNLDQYAKKTYNLYTSLYARCIKNFALDTLAVGGIYIAGGIAAKNIELFEQERFTKEFVNCGKQMELLQEIPIHVITDYNVSLYGAAQFMLLEKTCLQ